MKREFNSLIKSLLRSTGGGNLKRQTKTVKSSERLSQALRLMTILILLGTMPVSSVYAQKDCEHSYENGICSQCEDYQQPENGDGTESNPYQIANAGNLYWFAEYVNNGNTSANAKLTADINVNAGYTINNDGTVTNGVNTYIYGSETFPDDFKTWIPIGKNNNITYKGTFDGNNKTVSGLYINNIYQNYGGLFGFVSKIDGVGVVKNVGLVNSYFKASAYVGCIAGTNNGTILNCYSTGYISASGYNHVGGIAGYNNGTILNCYNTGSICISIGFYNIGGIAGYNSGTISNCYNTGSISEGDQSIGGIAGYNNGSISNCYYLNVDGVNSGIFGIGGTSSDGTNTVSKTNDDFSSGEVAWLLQKEQTTQEIVVWGQNIDNGQTDQEYPVLNGAKVYRRCNDEDKPYSNTEPEDAVHIYDNGFCGVCGVYAEPSQDGDVYQIANAGNLYWFAEYVNAGDQNARSANAKLTANITVNDGYTINDDGSITKDNTTYTYGSFPNDFKTWTPIGNSPSNSYLGSFDGQGYTVSGLYVNNSNQNYVGLFGYVSKTDGVGVVKNVGLVESYFYADRYVGGIVGYNDQGTESNCYNAGVVKGYSNIGGIVGCNSGTVSNCYNTGNCEGHYSSAGGIVGYVKENGEVSNCYNTGSVKATYMIGGIAGYNNYGTILNCYNTGSISSGELTEKKVGGIVGCNKYGTILNCYNTGPTGANGNVNDIVGGIVGLNYEESNNGKVSNCYYLSTTAYKGIGNNQSDVVGQAVSKTNDEFASGEVAYLLQKAQTSQVTVIWGQNIDNGQEVQFYPVLNGSTVYEVNCTCSSNTNNTNNLKAYSNSELTSVAHAYVNGFCTFCGAYQPATQYTEDVYLIANAGNLYWFAALVNGDKTIIGESVQQNTSANARLTADIIVNQRVLNENGELNGDGSNFREWTPIGCYYNSQYNQNYYYSGTFDGNDKTISGLYCSQDGTQPYVGLFSYIASASVQDLGVIDSYFEANNNASGIVGYLGSQAIVSNCYNLGTVSVVYNNAGGIAVNNYGTVQNCYNAGLVKAGQERIGGIVSSNDGAVLNCYNIGGVTGNSFVGGIVGNNQRTISNCYNTGSVNSEGSTSTTIYAGGIVGNNTGENATISNCYNTGSVNSEGSTSTTIYAGGIVGNNTDNATISNCYYLYGTAAIGIGQDSNSNQTQNVLSKTYEEFASGEVSYLLQASQTTQVWGQNIDNGQEREYYPVFSSARVYRTGEEDNYEYTNKIGGDVLWSYEEAVLTIYGSGSMIDFASNETKPWSNYLPYIYTVIVKEEITRIGAYAFSDVIDNAKIFFYRTEAPESLGTNCFKANASVYVPAFRWNTDGWSPKPTVMPTYTQTTDNGQRTTAWLGLTAGVTEPSSEDHVAINANMTINSAASLTVNSFGYCSDDVRITIEDGGQLTCQKAHGEVTVEKEIQSYSQEPTSKSQSSTKWYTISSPLKGSVLATKVENLISNIAENYALYRYDEPTHYWQNYKKIDNHFTTLDSGRGYLYANANGVTLSFEGEINTEPVPYILTAQGEKLTGFHLIGNPFTHNITASNFLIDNTGNEGSSVVSLATGYYVLSNQGAWDTYLGDEGEIKPGQAALIKVDIEGSQQTNPILGLFPDTYLEYLEHIGSGTKGQEPTAKNQQPMLSLNVTNSNYSDRAFVIFGKGIGLDKINHQNEEIPVLYIPMSDADYAIAMMDESVNEIPVGFGSSSMGEFTISLRQENCEFKELYLLDKETGAKVNILEQDYTFMATSGDNPDRFILVKSQGSQPEAQSNFAYINNGDVVIYGAEGNAHIDIYDVLGRRVYNNNGSDDVHIVTTDGYSAGVYVIRLMDEKGLRTQKVIID